jgi:hypothetical protein
MRNAISFDSVRDVRIGPTKSVIIAGKDFSGADAEIFLKIADVPKVAAPLLCCAFADQSPSPPLIGTIIPGCHLPIRSFATGISTFNGEPILILEIFGGTTLTFQLPSQSAIECGKQLVQKGEATGPKAGERAN